MSDDMLDDTTQAEEAPDSRRDELANALEEYPGYEQSEERRISDESLRAVLANTLEDFLAQAESLNTFLLSKEKGILSRRTFDLIEEIERLQGRIDPAPYAISPFFFAPRLPAELQERTLQNDWELLQESNAVEEILKPTLGEETDFEPLLQTARNALDSLAATLEQRFVLVTEFQG